MKQLLTTLLLVYVGAAWAEIKLDVSIYPEEGWMENGWGQIVLQSENSKDHSAKLQKVECAWMKEDGTVLKEWSRELTTALEPGGSRKDKLATWFDPSVIRNGEGRIAGRLIYENSGEPHESPFEISVPVALLPEKTRTTKGKKIWLTFMESRFSQIDNMDAVLYSMDEMYTAMHQLTGYEPFDGKPIDFRESPRHFAWAYAGNPTILNTAYVEGSIKGYSRGELNFGWIHELGHDFDNGIGKWYIPSGQWAEWQANFKLSYAWEMRAHADSTFRPRLWQPGESRSTLPMVTGRQFNDAYFIPFGINYLADASRSWKSLKSDEIHSFHTLLVRKYGWELFKNWYRAYPALIEKGYKPPKSPKDKVLLECALLSEICGIDLSSVFIQWRLPVTQKDIERIKNQYPVNKVTAKLNGNISGKWIDPPIQ